MSFIVKPTAAHPKLPKNALGLTRREYEGAVLKVLNPAGWYGTTLVLATRGK